MRSEEKLSNSHFRVWEHGLTTEMQEDFWEMLSHKSVAINLTSISTAVGFLQPCSLLTVGWQ